MEPQVNRAEQLWKNWEDKQRELEAIPGVNMLDRGNLKFKYDFLQKGLYRISVNPTEREKLYLHVIRTVTAKLEKQLYPNPVERALHRINIKLTKPGYLKQFEKNKEENIGQLKTDLKLAGLDFFCGDLKTFLDYERPKLGIGVQSRLDDNTGLRIGIELEKDKFGSYLFKGYQVSLIDKEGKDSSKDFSKESQITLREATNLLQGRAVLKCYANTDGTVTKKWTQLDFSNDTLNIETFSPRMSYNLKMILIDHATELDFYGITKEAVQQSLEQGDLVSVEISGKGKFHIQASPGVGSLKFYDHDNRAIDFLALKKQIKEPEQEKSTNIRLIKQNDISRDNNLSIGR